MTLTLIPTAALLGLWTFAMVTMTGDLRALIRLQGVYEQFGTPVDTAVGQIQVERRLSAEYLGARNGTMRMADLTKQQRRTDEAVHAMRAAVGHPERVEGLTERQRSSLSAMVDAVEELPALRARVIDRKVSWDRAVDGYTEMVEPTFAVQSSLTALQAGHLAREAQVVVELVRVREFVSREDALVAGARAAGRFDARQYHELTATIEDRRVFQRTYVPALPEDSRAMFDAFERSRSYRSLTAAEDTLLTVGRERAGRAAAAASWRTTTDRAVDRYMLLCSDAARNSAARGRGFAVEELLRAGVAGGVGLAAVGLSLWLSVRTGRRIARRLEDLRDAADVLATRQLPDVMARLSAGEEVDAAAAAPPLSYGDETAGRDELGQLGSALNTARRAAVEAAVKQASLRKGVFAVLLNIARRNQALVHRQLKLVDTLERRTNDPDVLQELFRIDHLTTRMRRHAEGLIILSGAAPGRRWRKPVPVVDVVGAAAGEIEDYARVVVPPMPAVGVVAEAVADVVHLIAELIENATVFSPPHTQVTMRLGDARHGVVLEIDDRGLGMDLAELEEANRTLARAGDFDPAQAERLGLYVVGRLAGRHGIGVTLCRSPYGGTTAVVLLPHTILAELPAEGRGEQRGGRKDTPAQGARPVAGNASEGDRTPGGPAALPKQADGDDRAVPEPADGDDRSDAAPAAGPAAAAGPGAAAEPVAAGPASAEPAPDAPAPAGPVPAEPSGTDGPGAAPAVEHHRLPRRMKRPEPLPQREAPAAEASTDAARTTTERTGSAGSGKLPTRIRQASLAPQLRTDTRAQPGGSRGESTTEGRGGEDSGEEVSPEEMGAIFGAFQRGLRRGRDSEPQQPDTDHGSEQ
ncbi:nitrate- and nitrite sensing domain-containing protein [Streptomyces sp. NPDC001922]|uniref:sensor histidine kinase n=1 Tax=Streptomyces sp. NPDC001922 TaxID=3364624 RepID=UPI0036C91C2C